MTDLVHDLQKLQALSRDVHWLCPKTGPDDTTLYAEDDPTQSEDEDGPTRQQRERKIKDALERRELVLKSLQLLAFDGADAQTFRRQYEQGLERQFKRCDACIRAYYRSLPGYMESLEGNYEVEEVRAFQGVVDHMNLERIKSGLAAVTKELQNLPAEQRNVTTISQAGSYAIFEAMSCPRFLQDSKFLPCLEEPFRLVQTNKRLRMMCYVPAMIYFLFDDNEDFYQWAYTTFVRFKPTITQSDFDWCIRQPLARAMDRVDISNLDRNYLGAFWSGVRLIVKKLDKTLITHSLRAMDQDIYRLALEHLQFDDECFQDLLGTLHNLILKAPHDFWDAMGPISPVTIIEQIFASPSMERILRSAGKNGDKELGGLEDCLAWIDPFMSSIRPVNQTPACRALLNQLFGRVQDPHRHYHDPARNYCYTLGLRSLEQVLRSLYDNNSTKTPVSDATVFESLSLAQEQIPRLATAVRSLASSPERKTEASAGLQVLQRAVALTCRAIHVDFELLQDERSLQRQSGTNPDAFWRSVVKSADTRDLIINVLHGCRELTGVEPFSTPSSKRLSNDQRDFNERFESLCEPIESLLDRLSGYAEKDLRTLLNDPNDASAIFAALFSSGDEVHKAALEVVKAAAGETERRQALKFVVDRHYANSTSMSSNYLRRIAHSKIFTPMPRVVKLCGDILDVLCDPADGILRSRRLTLEQSRNTEGFWQASWQILSVIFLHTEQWSFAGYDKNLMKDFCRDAMQFADRLFDEYAIFASSIKAALSNADKQSANSANHLLQMPKQTTKGIVKWLRLRDEYLSTKSVSLTCKILVRLQEESIELGEQVLSYIEGIIDGTTRHAIQKQQVAELRRALEIHAGVSLDQDEVKSEKHRLTLKAAGKSALQSRLDMTSWKASAASRQTSSGLSSGADTDEELKKFIDTKSGASKQMDIIRQRQEVRRLEEARKKQETQKRRDAAFATSREKMIKDRKAAQAANEKEKAAAIAQARAIRGGPDANGAGSGVRGVGVQGKEHSLPKGEGMYVSDDSGDDGESGSDMDRELFGIKRSSKPMKIGMDPALVPKMPQGPVKKKKIVRSAADMRARLQPNLTWLHETVLGWDYFHDGDFPPNAREEEYMKAPDKFSTPTQYQQVFKPLLTLEAWQQFVKAKEEGSSKAYDVKIQNRSSVDAFVEVATSLTHAENKDVQIMEGDIVLLSKGKTPTAMPEESHCLSRVHKISRKKQHLEIMYRVVPGNDLLSSLAPGVKVFGVKVTSIIPLEREYAALHALQFYDLCDEIVKAKPSPLLKYNDKQLEPIIANYNVNNAQAKAVKSAIDNDAFTLIQGPPGSGKTKTIVAIVGALLSSILSEDKGRPIQLPKQNMNGSNVTNGGAPPKKLMVCAPSNAAVDELVMRFKQGVRTLSGAHKKLNVVRIGRSDAINTQVTDVTLDELVSARMNVSHGQNGDAKAKSQVIFQEHKAISEKLNEVRDQMDSGIIKGDAASKLQDEFNTLRRRKQQLGSQIDEIKDKENSLGRQTELNRIRVQQSILDESHVICATLSGSGHDMFRNLNVEFETVVVDEAAQCVEVSSIIPLKYGCSKCILVGDPKQLPPTVFSKEAVKFAYERSLFVRMQSNHPDSVHLLDTQYRMHPEISYFPSKAFYDSRLLDGPDMAVLRKQPWHTNPLLSPYRFFDVQGQHQAAPRGHSLINLAEIEFAMKLYDQLMTEYAAYDFTGKIGIITPYKSQLRELKDRFSRKYGQAISGTVEFNTTDAFQGRESEVIIFSCVRASPAGGIGFLQDIRRMNVGLTRAKSSLWVLGNSESLARGDFWRRLIDSSKERNRYTAGNLAQMLQSSGGMVWKPEPGNANQPSHRRSVKPEMSQQNNVEVKMEIDEPVRKQSLSMNFPAKRKAPSSDGSDVDMKDASDPDEKKVKQEENGYSAKSTGGSGNRKGSDSVPLSKQPHRREPVSQGPRKKGDPFLPKPKRPKP